MMKSILLLFVMSMVAVPALASDSLPPDVKRFIERREGCDHMRGELPGPGEKQRMNEVNREIQKLCKGTDKQLIALKKKYATNEPIMRHLREFEEGIEASAAH